MDKAKKIARIVITKYGNIIAGCAFAFVAFAANSACMLPFYEPEEPQGLNEFKKFN